MTIHSTKLAALSALVAASMSAPSGVATVERKIRNPGPLAPLVMRPAAKLQPGTNRVSQKKRRLRARRAGVYPKRR